ncbi:MAG TPA: hypothetical protein EYP59_18430 [Thiotrichaceae bacterium]|nr:hypothetical protein [Thiotrichaceae bacterium]
MPLKIPNLDNKTYDELTDRLITSIPKFSDNWTNFNPSDPGITILELLAYVSDTLLYRINWVPYQTYVNFLKMLVGVVTDDDLKKRGDVKLDDVKLDNVIYDALKPPSHDNPCCNEYVDYDRQLLNVLKILIRVEAAKPQEIPLHELQKVAIEYINCCYRSVTKEDFVSLAIDATRSPNGDIGKVKRAVVLQKKIPPETLDIRIVTDTDDRDKYDKLTLQVQQFLDIRKLIGTRLKVQEPEYTSLTIKVVVKLTADANKNETTKIITECILAYLASVRNETQKRILEEEYISPAEEGRDINGWDYGRDLYVYDIYNLVNKVVGVEEVKEVVFDNTNSNKKTVTGLIDIKEDDIIIKNI